MEKLGFYLNKKMVYVEVVRTSNKNMYLRVKDTNLVVSAPKKISDEHIREFVQQHIEKFSDYIDKKKEAPLYSFKDNFVYLNGKKYTIYSLTGFPKTSITIKGNNAYIHTKSGDEQEMEKAIKDYIKAKLIKYLDKKIKVFEKKMNLADHTFNVRYKTGTWGSNKIGTNTLSFSSRLWHYRDEIIDYVIVHELAHTFEPNHSAAFWDVVYKYMPNSKELRKELKPDQPIGE